MPAAAPIAGARTACWGSPTANAGCAFALALWNGKDPILKERLFGLTNPEGNHGEDVKECYFYLDATPTYSYLKGLYKYPQAEFPYARLVEENRRRGTDRPEFELADTGIFDEDRYFDIFVEYAKVVAQRHADPDHRRQPRPGAGRAPLAADPLVSQHLDLGLRPRRLLGQAVAAAGRRGGDRLPARDLGRFRFHAGPASDGRAAATAFHRKRDERRAALRLGQHDAVRQGRLRRVRGPRPPEAVSPEARGTKAAAHYVLHVAAGAEITMPMRLFAEEEAPPRPFGADFDRVFARRIAEADEFYRDRIRPAEPEDDRRISRQAYAGLLWSKQFYHYVVKDWLDGDPNLPPPAEGRKQGRNHDWRHLFNRDVISMPDKWEYPVVCGLGPGVSHDPVGADRSAVRQGAAHAVPARMVHAPQRADPGLRVRLSAT